MACSFHRDTGKRIESEMGVLDGRIDCEDITHCSDNRTLLSGLELELSIDVTGQPPDAISVATDNPDLLQLDGFTNEADVCRDGTNTQVEGRLRFDGVGEAALIVMNGRDEIDRFTWWVDEAASLSVQAELLDPERVVDLGNVEQLELEVGVTALLRARAANREGSQLLAGPRFEWTIGDAPPTKPTGSSTFLRRDAPGELDIEVALGDLTHTVHVTVAASSSN